MNDPIENNIRRDNVETSRRKDKLFRDILRTWPESELLECLTRTDLVDAVIESNLADKARDEIMREPQYAELRRKALLSDDLECIRLCGNAKTPEEERQLYLDAMGAA